MRTFALNFKENAEKITAMEKKYNQQFKDIYEALDYLMQEKQTEKDFKERTRIGFKK